MKCVANMHTHAQPTHYNLKSTAPQVTVKYVADSECASAYGLGADDMEVMFCAGEGGGLRWRER